MLKYMIKIVIRSSSVLEYTSIPHNLTLNVDNINIFRHV